MKKITLLFIALCFSTLSFSQIVLSEDFEAGLTLPTGWTNNDLAVPANGEIWTFETGGEAGGYTAGNTFIYDPAGCEGNYATFDSDGYGDNSTPEEATLESPVFSCATLTDVTLNFNHLFGGDFGGSGFVEVYDGTSWVTVQTYTGDGNDFGLKSLDVTTELAGVANAQIRFRWTGNWSLSWTLDNISVFQCTVAAPNAAAITEPLNAATDIPIDITGATPLITPFSWDAATTGDLATSFNITLGTDTAGTNIGTITGATNGNGITYGSWAYNTTYYWFVTAVNCAGETPGPIFSFTTAACTALGAPNPVISPGPADGATNVVLDQSDPSFPDRVYFSWVDGIGDSGESFTLNLGTTDPPTDSSFDGFPNGDFIFNLAENTTYFWSIEAINCVGTSTPTVWSFTTEAALSIDENQINLFSVYPNPVNDVLKIETELSIDSILISNQLGQNILSIDGNKIFNNEVDLSSLTSGLYFMNISSDDKSQSIKVIKE